MRNLFRDRVEAVSESHIQHEIWRDPNLIGSEEVGLPIPQAKGAKCLRTCQRLIETGRRSNCNKIGASIERTSARGLSWPRWLTHEKKINKLAVDLVEIGGTTENHLRS